MAEIIAALAKLTHEQRRQLCQRLFAFEADQEDLIRCDQSAAEAFSHLDNMESKPTSVDLISPFHFPPGL